MKRTKKKQKTKTTTTTTRKPDELRQPFVEHLYELRRRSIYVVASILLFSTLAYFVQQHLVNLLLRPAHGQQFIYTSPGGGINFLFTICTYVGIAASLPVIIYNVLRYLEPVTTVDMRRFIARCSYASVAMAALGLGFGYFIGLPAALHFLRGQFTTNQIKPLFTLQEYMSFVTVYLLGAALLFQLPLLLVSGNRIRPIPPGSLLKAEKYVIAAAFIIAMIMAPTPNIFDQLIIAVPVIIIYNIGALIVWSQNKRRPSVPAVAAAPPLTETVRQNSPPPMPTPQPPRSVPHRQPRYQPYVPVKRSTPSVVRRGRLIQDVF
ncbi:MAG TPA: twin-arginine translocase subunit TatC [Candidatus Dormibacteraeota bacterium]|nr:twin-arginine translocase subunit TatC [Candidatus Dormibacteraeota bacterium]